MRQIGYRKCRRCGDVFPLSEYGTSPDSRKPYSFCVSCRRETGALVEFVVPGGTDASFGHWLAGFADGEGCFRIVPTYNDGFHCQFQIAVRDDDAEVIHEIHRRTGLGRVRSRKGVNGWNPQVEWSVRSLSECAKLVALFDLYPLRAKKRRDFAIWREAVHAWANHRKNGDWSDMASIKDKLRDTRAYV